MSDRTDRDRDDYSPSLTMRAVRVVQDSGRPRWYEIMVGAGLLAVAVYVGVGLLGHDGPHAGHSHAVPWTFVGIVGTVGLWLLAPVRAERLWREARDVLPFLPPPDSRDSGDSGGED